MAWVCRWYVSEALIKVEQDRVFEGPVWNFLCLENEVADPGDWRTTVVGQMPVVVARDADGSIAAFENRFLELRPAPLDFRPRIRPGPASGRTRRETEIKFAVDSPLEGSGFEPTVPP